MNYSSKLFLFVSSSVSSNRLQTRKIFPSFITIPLLTMTLPSQGTSPLLLCSLLHVSVMDTSDKETVLLANQTLEYLLLPWPLTELWKEHLQRITSCFFTTSLRNHVFYIGGAPESGARYLTKFYNPSIKKKFQVVT